MDEDISSHSDCINNAYLDIDLKPFELDALKEIESFNENKSVDFNFKLKLPVG